MLPVSSSFLPLSNIFLIVILLDPGRITFPVLFQLKRFFADSDQYVQNVLYLTMNRSVIS